MNATTTHNTRCRVGRCIQHRSLMLTPHYVHFSADFHSGHFRRTLFHTRCNRWHVFSLLQLRSICVSSFIVQQHVLFCLFVAENSIATTSTSWWIVRHFVDPNQWRCGNIVLLCFFPLRLCHSQRNFNSMCSFIHFPVFNSLIVFRRAKILLHPNSNLLATTTKAELPKINSTFS